MKKSLITIALAGSISTLMQGQTIEGLAAKVIVAINMDKKLKTISSNLSKTMI